MILHVSQLEKQPQELEGEEPPEFLDLGARATFEIASPLRYRLTARLVSGEVLVTGKLRYRIRGVCGRCLREITPEITVENLSLLLEKPDTEEMDIAGEIREEALLVLPYNLLCSPDCKGLCPKCGADWNEKKCSCTLEKELPPLQDSPWAALDQLDLQNSTSTKES